MNKTNRTRYFVITAVLVTAVGLGTGLVAYYSVGHQLGALAGRDGPAELRYVPRDAAVLAYADVREIMASEVHQRMRRAVPASQSGQRQFLEQTGIDIESDIDHVVAYLVPHAGGSTAGLVLARGRFSDVKIEALMREHGAHVEDYGGKRLIVAATGPRPMAEGLSLSFLEPGLVAVGTAQMVRRAIDLRNNRDDITKNSEFMGMLRSVDQSHAWVVGQFDALRADWRLPAEISGRLPAITWFSLSARVDSSVTGLVRADSRDEEAAKNLGDVIRGFLALARLQAGSRPAFRALTESLQLGGTGKSLTLSFSVPGEVFDAIAGMHPGGPADSAQPAH